MKQHSQSLSPRELEVVALFTQGAQYKQIARDMNISYKTVTAFLSRICEKLGAENNTELLFLLAKSSGGSVVARVWNVNQGQDLQPCWAPVTEKTPTGFATYLVVEAT
jgi:DNA-binding CsgD family transcriptional regulator